MQLDQTQGFSGLMITNGFSVDYDSSGLMINDGVYVDYDHSSLMINHGVSVDCVLNIKHFLVWDMVCARNSCVECTRQRLWRAASCSVYGELPHAYEADLHS